MVRWITCWEKTGSANRSNVLRGNPEYVRELIDGCDFARAYTSGVLSFQEPDIADAEKSRLMDEWEHTLLPGLDRDQYACLWVEHRDKERRAEFCYPEHRIAERQTPTTLL